MRIGANGKPLRGESELSIQQNKVVQENKKAIRKEVNAVGKENKKNRRLHNHGDRFLILPAINEYISINNMRTRIVYSCMPMIQNQKTVPVILIS